MVRTISGPFFDHRQWTHFRLTKTAKTVKGPKVPKQPIKYLSREATTALLAASGTMKTKERRNKVILIMLYDTGARVSELCGICVCDLHLSKPAFVSIVGKGNKPRNVPLMDKTVEHLEEYMKEFHSDSPQQNSSHPLFYSNRKGKREPLSPDSISSILSSCAERARETCPDIPENTTCHVLRKTRAMDLHQEGVPLPIIMRFLGHENMNTTQTFYAFATMGMVTAAIESTSSLGSLEPKRWKDDSAESVIYSLK